MPAKAKSSKHSLASKKRSKSTIRPAVALRSWMIVPAVLCALVLGYAWVSFAKAATPTKPCNGVNMCAPIPTGVPELIQYWSEYYSLDGARMLRIAQCESRLDPRAQSRGGHYGVYQFLPNTYAANYQAAGAGPDYWDAGNNVRTAAYMFSIGQAWQWECKG